MQILSIFSKDGPPTGFHEQSTELFAQNESKTSSHLLHTVFLKFQPSTDLGSGTESHFVSWQNLQLLWICRPMLLCWLWLPWGSPLSLLRVNETHSTRQHVTWLDQGTFRNESCERFQNKSIWSCEAAQNIHEFYRKDKRNVEKVEEGWLQTSHLQLLEFPAAFFLGKAR